jgi:hypothetical protein
MPERWKRRKNSVRSGDQMKTKTIALPILGLIFCGAGLAVPRHCEAQTLANTAQMDTETPPTANQFADIHLIDFMAGSQSLSFSSASESSSNAPWILPAQAPASAGGHSSLPRLGIGVKIGLLGVGVEAATAVMRRANLRGGFNDFTFNRAFSKDGIHYGGRLQLRSVEAHFDYYLFGGFHIGPGALLYNGNKGTATASVPAGNSFTLGGTTYYSDAADPVTGSGTLSLNKFAPMVTLGSGNLLPRSHRHWSINLEGGFAFQGSPKVGLNLAGSTCDVTGTVCQPISSNANIQANIASEEAKIDRKLRPFKYYPVFSIGFGWKIF